MRKVIRRHIRHRSGGVDVVADINAVIAVNHGDSQHEVVSSHAEAADDVRRTGGSGPAEEPDREQDPNKEDR
jgi:hypothetical protein